MIFWCIKYTYESETCGLNFPFKHVALKISGESVWQSVPGIWIKMELFFSCLRSFIFFHMPLCDAIDIALMYTQRVAGEILPSGEYILSLWKERRTWTFVGGVTAVYKYPKPNQTIFSWNKGMGKQDTNYTGDMCCGTAGCVLMTSVLPSQSKTAINIGVTFARQPVKNSEGKPALLSLAAKAPVSA